MEYSRRRLSVFVVAKPDVPVCAVAERLVLGASAAAQREMLARLGRLAGGRVPELGSADHVIGPVLGHRDLRLALRVRALDAVDRACERARWAAPHDLDDGLRVRAVGVDP